MNLSTVLLLAIAEFVPGQFTECDCARCREAARLFVQATRGYTPAGNQSATPQTSGPLPTLNGKRRESGSTDLERSAGTPVEANIRLHIRTRNPALPEETCARFQALISRECKRRGLPPALVTALISRESSFNPEARSPSGALGLGQLMPQTLSDLGVEDPFDPEQSIRACAQLVATHLEKWREHPERDRLALASYRVGYSSVVESGGVPESPTVVEFVNSVLSLAEEIASAGATPKDGTAP